MRGFTKIVKGIYFTWTNDPPNTKIKDWNVTELKVRPSHSPSLCCSTTWQSR